MSNLSQIVTANVINRVLNIRMGKNIGTAFTLEVDRKQYIITAKHIIGENSTSHMAVRQGDWIQLDVEPVGVGDGPVDIAVFAAKHQLTTDHQVEFGSKGIIVGQNIRFLGYPLGLQMGYATGNPGIEIPMVKAGILSGIATIQEGKRGGWLFVDGHNNRGFSGGPIIYKSLATESDPSQPWKIAGVVSSYINEELEVMDATGRVAGTVRGNSGILAGADIELALEMINANPIGFRLP